MWLRCSRFASPSAVCRAGWLRSGESGAGSGGGEHVKARAADWDC